MVHEKYIKINGKTYGPYNYESYREDGKVKKRYIKTSNKKVGVSNKKVEEGRVKDKINKGKYLKVGIFLIISLLVFLVFNSTMTGKVGLDIDTNYVIGEQIRGVLNLNLVSGEHVPASSKILINNAGEVSEYLLSDLVSDEKIEGDFYIDNLDVSGTGSGYGVLGEREVYPEVEFVLKIVELEAEDTGGVGGEEIISEPVVEEVVAPKGVPRDISNTLKGTSEMPTEGKEEVTEEITSKPVVEEPIVEEVAEEVVEEVSEPVVEEPIVEEVAEEEASFASTSTNADAPSGNSARASVPASDDLGKSESETSPITGAVVSETSEEIKGIVSNDNEFVYDLEKGQSVEVISSSKDIEFKIKGNSLIVTTDYSEVESGFGEDFLGELELELKINLTELNLVASEGNLEVVVLYDEMEIVSAVEKISVFEEVEVEENETVIVPENNITIVNETIVPENNVTVVNGTSNFTIETIQYGAVINKPVKWKKTINMGSEELENISVELPKSAENITVYKIEKEVVVDEGIEEEVEMGNDLVVTNETESAEEPMVIEVGNNESSQKNSEKGKKNKEKKNKEKKVSKQIITGKVISGKISAEIEIENEKRSSFFDFFSKFFASITGRAITTEENLENTQVKIDNIFAENVSSFEIEYETEAPLSYETNISGGKQIIVSGPDELNYQNILAYAEVPVGTSVGDIKLYWIVNSSLEIAGEENETFVESSNETIVNDSLEIIYSLVRQEISFTSVDLDNDSVVDYIEWVVPHLSNQTYELIIEITKAEHLDSNRTFIADVYEYVAVRDDNWTTIPTGDYLRVTFEQELDSSKDITLYARAGCNESVLINGIEVSCEIYEKKMRIDEIRRLIGR